MHRRRYTTRGVRPLVVDMLRSITCGPQRQAHHHGLHEVPVPHPVPRLLLSSRTRRWRRRICSAWYQSDALKCCSQATFRLHLWEPRASQRFPSRCHLACLAHEFAELLVETTVAMLVTAVSPESTSTPRQKFKWSAREQLRLSFVCGVECLVPHRAR